MDGHKLKLPNENNCLACDAFIVINFAPKDPVKEKDLEEKTYLVESPGVEKFNAKIVDLYTINFKTLSMSSMITLPATGLEADAWAREWKQKYPATKNDTRMCVYFYKKLK